jgi:mono/diheme cytochrome c family protein
MSPGGLSPEPQLQKECPSMRTPHLGIRIALGLGVAAACLAQAASPARAPDRVYAVTCQYCHDTGIGPPLKGAQLAPERIRLAVRQGYRSMLAFAPSEITDAELAALVRMLSEAAPQTSADGVRP